MVALGMNEEYIPADSLPYFARLKHIRETLEREISLFPRFQCQKATRVVHAVMGLEELAGIYVPAVRDESIFNRSHAWNYDEKLGLYVDLTQDQFDSKLPKIAVLPADTYLLEKNGRKTRDQREYDFSRLNPIIEKIKATFPANL